MRCTAWRNLSPNSNLRESSEPAAFLRPAVQERHGKQPPPLAATARPAQSKRNPLTLTVFRLYKLTGRTRYYGRYNNEVDQAIDKRKGVIEDELLAENDLGRQILKLRQERESLLDAIWLATSPKQVKDLWSKVADLLGDEPTQLERDALAIPPVADD